MTNHRYYKRQSEKIFDAYEYWYLQDQKYSKQNKKALNRQLRTITKREDRALLKKYRWWRNDLGYDR